MYQLMRRQLIFDILLLHHRMTARSTTLHPTTKQLGTTPQNRQENPHTHDRTQLVREEPTYSPSTVSTKVQDQHTQLPTHNAHILNLADNCHICSISANDDDSAKVFEGSSLICPRGSLYMSFINCGSFDKTNILRNIFPLWRWGMWMHEGQHAKAPASRVYPASKSPLESLGHI